MMEIVFKRMAPYIKTSYDSKAKLMTLFSISRSNNRYNINTISITAKHIHHCLMAFNLIKIY